jgi:trypsin
MFPLSSEKPENAIEMSETLQFLRVNVISNRECNFRIALRRLDNEPRDYVMSSHICTYNRVGQGLCYGDSGSGLTTQGFLVGIVSRGIAPCAQGFPDVYTRITVFISWINSHIRRV